MSTFECFVGKKWSNNTIRRNTPLIFVNCVISLLLIIILFTIIYKRTGILMILLPLTFLVLLINFKEIISLRNISLCVFFFTFVIGSHLHFTSNGIRKDLCVDFVIYSLFYIFGYNYYYILPKNIIIKVNKVNNQRAIYCKHLLERIFWFLLLLRCGVFSIKIVKVGFYNWWAGEMLVKSIQQYAEGGSQVAIIILSNWFVNIIVWTSVIFYVSICRLSNSRPRLGLPVLLLVVFPLLELSRGGVFTGVLFLLVASRLLGGRKSVLIILTSVIVVIIIASFIGALREKALRPGLDLFRSSGLIQMLGNTIAGEFSQVVAYREIKDNIGQLGYQYGKTIALPFVTKPIPRAIWPEKPLNSSAYYMYYFHPDSAKAGFFLAPTIFGDLYLNFGFVGCIIGAFFWGLINAFADGVITGRLKTVSYVKLALSILLFVNCYSLVRNNISDSVFSVLLTCIGVILYGRFLSPYNKLKRYQVNDTDANRH